MNYINLYYVKDCVEDKVITTILSASSHLSACLGFRNAYILSENDKKPKIPYKNLELVCCGKLKVLENGTYIQDINSDTWSIKGSDIMDYIRSQINEKGLDDGFLDEEEE